MTPEPTVAPGRFVAHRSGVTPGTTALGIVTADGAHVVWLAQVDTDAEGVPRLRESAARVCRTPVRVRGDEIACPEALLPFARTALARPG